MPPICSLTSWFWVMVHCHKHPALPGELLRMGGFAQNVIFCRVAAAEICSRISLSEGCTVVSQSNHLLQCPGTLKLCGSISKL